MRSPQAKIAIVTVVLLILTVGLGIYGVLQQTRIDCEVCVSFHGRTQCRAASGPDRDEAIETAIDNACGFLSSGMADSISCSKTEPDSVTCND
jgi:hypothetical protein